MIQQLSYSPGRPVPRWLHIWSIFSVVCVSSLVVLGGLVTTYRAGMADPVWPTEPWYLADNYKLDFGYLIEHYHRILGWLLGFAGLVLAVGMWVYEPDKKLRTQGFSAMLALVVFFGMFHSVMRRYQKSETTLTMVYINIALMILAAAVTIWLAIKVAKRSAPGSAARAVVLFGMIAGMIQGLFGGFRVLFNALIGPEFAIIHGMFAQIVFGLLVTTMILTAKPSGRPGVLPSDYRKLRWQTIALVIFAYGQILFGVLVRHSPDSLSTRLHLIFAFVVLGFATLVIKQGLLNAQTKARLKLPAYIFMGLITLQIILGVEAWVGKFLFVGYTKVLTEDITTGKVIIRGLHAHIGTWIFGLSIILMLLARKKGESNSPGASESLKQSVEYREPATATVA